MRYLEHRYLVYCQLYSKLTGLLSSYQSSPCLSSTAGGSSIAYCGTSDDLKLLRVPVAESVGRAGTHRSMRLRQPSQKAWPHVTRMRGTTPSLCRTASQSQSVPAAGGSRDSKTQLDLGLARMAPMH